MDYILLIIRAFLLPLLLCVLLLSIRFKSLRTWLLLSMFTFSWTMLMLMFADWTFISQYLRIAILLLLPITILTSLWRHRRLPWSHKRHPQILEFIQWLLIIQGATLVMITLLRIPAVLFHQQPAGDSIVIQFPLKGGIYSISHGGNSTALNYHFEYHSQKHAIDIVKLNILGITKRPFSSLPKLEDYIIYGEPVYSPVSGKVVKVIDGISEELKKEIPSTASNMVIIEHQNVYILLLHLQKESIRVKDGDLVKSGQWIANVGNSGYSTEPHLHIHAVKRQDLEEEDFRGSPVPLIVDGVQLKRNDLILNEQIFFR